MDVPHWSSIEHLQRLKQFLVDHDLAEPSFPLDLVAGYVVDLLSTSPGFLRRKQVTRRVDDPTYRIDVEIVGFDMDEKTCTASVTEFEGNFVLEDVRVRVLFSSASSRGEQEMRRMTMAAAQMVGDQIEEGP